MNNKKIKIIQHIKFKPDEKTKHVSQIIIYIPKKQHKLGGIHKIKYNTPLPWSTCGAENSEFVCACGGDWEWEGGACGIDGCDEGGTDCCPAPMEANGSEDVWGVCWK